MIKTGIKNTSGRRPLLRRCTAVLTALMLAGALFTGNGMDARADGEPAEANEAQSSIPEQTINISLSVAELAAIGGANGSGIIQTFNLNIPADTPNITYSKYAEILFYTNANTYSRLGVQHDSSKAAGVINIATERGNGDIPAGTYNGDFYAFSTVNGTTKAIAVAHINIVVTEGEAVNPYTNFNGETAHTILSAKPGETVVITSNDFHSINKDVVSDIDAMPTDSNVKFVMNYNGTTHSALIPGGTGQISTFLGQDGYLGILKMETVTTDLTWTRFPWTD